jgi:hypothetical protein
MVSKRWLPSAFVSVVAALFLLSLSLATESPPARGQVPNGVAEEIAARRSCDFPALTATNFTTSTTINNRYLPLLPGMQVVLEGTAATPSGVLPRRIVTTVTDLTKVIDGVRSVVLFEEDYTADFLVEAELAFVAQDDFGNVWNLGEHPALFEAFGGSGAAHTWLSGIDDALAGIRMPAVPSVELPRYSQGYAPNIGFFDCGQVAQTGVTVCILISSCFGDSIIIDENSPLESGIAIQRKYYAPNFGLIKVEAINDPEAETLERTATLLLGADAMNEVRAKALLLEESAYRLSVAYQQTAPIEQ